jgi:integrase
MKNTRLPMRTAIQLFDQAAVADGAAKSTLDNQRSHARKLEKAIREWEKSHKRWQPMQADEADSLLVSFYLARCVGGDGNRSNMTSYLRRLLKYCERNDWLAPGVTDKIMYGKKAKPFERKPKTYIDPSHFSTLLDCQTRHPSDRVTMALLLWTLRRKSELYGLQWKHVDLVNRRLTMYNFKKKRWMKVRVCPDLYRELCDYQEWYVEEMDGMLHPEWHVLPELVPHRVYDYELGHYGSGTTYTINPERHPHHMEKIIKHALDVIGVTDTEHGKTVNHVGEGAHTIRRSGARAMLKFLSAEAGFGNALDTVRAMLDHKDTKVTLTYIGMEKTADELDEWLLTNSPYGRAGAA